MRRFSFRLQRVLDVKRIHEDRVKTELAALEARRRAEAGRLADMQRQRCGAQDTLRQRLMADWAPDDISRTYRYLELLDGQIAEQDMVLRAAERRKESKREELIAASKERKTLERLREVEQERHRKQSLKEGVKQLDEFASRRSEMRRASTSRRSTSEENST